MEKERCTCTIWNPRIGHQMECYYSKQRVQERRDGRGKHLQMCCPSCRETQCQLNPQSCKCHGQITSNIPDGLKSQSKSGLIWVPKSTPTLASNGPIDTTISQDIIGDAHSAAATACGAVTNLTKAQKRKMRRKNLHTKRKGSRGGNAVVADIIRGSQESLGEIDALREQIDCILEEAGGTAPEEPEIPIFHVPSGLPRAVLQRMTDDFQGYQVVADATDNRPMPLKRYYEKYCVDTLPGRHLGTTIVGKERCEGAVLRHHVRTSDDVGVDADCACPPTQYCEICSLPLWVFVDSLHLWKPEELVQLLKQEFNPSVYSVQYEYRALRGGLHIAPGEAPELTWERRGSTLVCQDAAHSGKYVQEVADWVQAGGLRIGDTTLCCKIVGRVGQCVIYRLCVQDVPLMLTADADPLSDTFYGDTTPDRVGMGECVDVRLETIIGPITSMYAAGEILYCKVEDREVYLPKQAIGVVALWASGKRRNAKLYSDAYNQAKNWLKNTHLSAFERADCLPYIVAFGLLRNINTESRKSDRSHVVL